MNAQWDLGKLPGFAVGGGGGAGRGWLQPSGEKEWGSEWSGLRGLVREAEQPKGAAVVSQEQGEFLRAGMGRAYFWVPRAELRVGTEQGPLNE